MSAQIKLAYYENSYPDEGDFTLVYNLNAAKQQFQQQLNANFWQNLSAILDGVIQNVQIKQEWNDLRVHGYCMNDRCCDGCCKTCCTCPGCCGNGCLTMNCCRFCCCNGDCHCCIGNCKACLSFRDYYLGAVVLVVWGCFTIYNYPMVNPLALMMIVFGAIMIENHRISNELKVEWREKVIQSLSANLNPLGSQYGVHFHMERYGFFGIVLTLQLGGAQQQQQGVMLVVQQPQQAQTTRAPQQTVQMQPQLQYAQQPNAAPGFNAAYAPQQDNQTENEGGVTLS